MAKPSRRFIAAAKCPKCGKADVLYFTAELGEHFACIECGYDSERELLESAKKVIATDAARPDLADKKAQPVPIRIIDDPTKKH